MARTKSAFKQRDLTAAIKATVAGGLAIKKVAISPDGKIELVTDAPHESEKPEDISGLV